MKTITKKEFTKLCCKEIERMSNEELEVDGKNQTRRNAILIIIGSQVTAYYS